MLLFPLIRDAIGEFRRELLLIVSTGLFGALLKLGALFQIFLLIRTLAGANDILSASLDTNSLHDVWVYLLLGLVLAALGAITVYYSKCRLIELAGRAEIHYAKQLLVLASQQRKKGLPVKEIIRLTSSDARACARVLYMLITQIEPIVMISTGFIVLYILNGLLTLTLTIVITGATGLHIRNFRRGDSWSRLMMTNTNEATRERLTLFERLTNDPLTNEQAQQLIERRYLGSAICNALRGYLGRYRSLETSALINELTTLAVTVLALTVYVIFYWPLEETMSAGEFVFYFLVLGYSFSHGKNSVSTFLRVNNYRHQIERYFSFVRSQTQYEKNVPASQSSINIDVSTKTF